MQKTKKTQEPYLHSSKMNANIFYLPEDIRTR